MEWRTACQFCRAEAASAYLVTTTTPLAAFPHYGGVAETVTLPGWGTAARLALPLCAEHHAALWQAGAVAWVEGPTGQRWWIGAR